MKIEKKTPEDKFTIQENKYHFPYHYLAGREERKGAIQIHREWEWGIHYMAYMLFLSKIIKKHKPDSLLDVGCGDGRFISLIKDSIPNVTGIDKSSRAIAFAKAFNPGINFLCDDVSHIPWKYEFITLIEVLEHIPDNTMPHFLRNIRERLKPEGYLLLTVPTINIPLIRKHYRHYSLKLLSSSVEEEFELVEIWWLNKIGMIDSCVRFSLCNQLFTLNNTLFRSWLWQIYTSFCYIAEPHNARNLIALARPKSEKKFHAL